MIFMVWASESVAKSKLWDEVKEIKEKAEKLLKSKIKKIKAQAQTGTEQKDIKSAITAAENESNNFVKEQIEALVKNVYNNWWWGTVGTNVHIGATKKELEDCPETPADEEATLAARQAMYRKVDSNDLDMVSGLVKKYCNPMK